MGFNKTENKSLSEVIKHFFDLSNLENKNLENKTLNTINAMNNKGTNNFDFYKSLLNDIEGDTLLQEVETEEVVTSLIALVDNNQSFV